MPWQGLPITGPAYANVDEVELSDISPKVQDGYVDGANRTAKRPGLQEYVDLGTGASVHGLYWWDRHQYAIAVSGGRPYLIADGTPPIVTTTTGDLLTPGQPVTFAEHSDGSLLMANGGRIVRLVGTVCTNIADADAPTAVTHVLFLDQYILANEVGTGRFHYSDVNDPTSWQALSFATAEGKPDLIVAAHTGWREIYLVGTKSIEIWYNDGVTPFSRLQGAFIESGCGAVASIIMLPPPMNTFVWLDDHRRVVRANNRLPEVISDPYGRVFSTLSRVDDARAFTVEAEGWPIYVLSFPTAQRTFAYNFGKGDWSEWGYWNLSTATYDQYRGNVGCYATAWGKHLVGDHTNGKVYLASRSVYTDAGNPIRTLRRLGHFDHGSLAFKRSSMLKIRAKRGLANGSVSDPQMAVRWRDGNRNWSTEHWLSLGQVGDHYLIGKLYGPLGTYETRQWEFIHTDDSDFILADAQEDVEMLR